MENMVRDQMENRESEEQAGVSLYCSRRAHHRDLKTFRQPPPLKGSSTSPLCYWGTKSLILGCLGCGSQHFWKQGPILWKFFHRLYRGLVSRWSKHFYLLSYFYYYIMHFISIILSGCASCLTGGRVQVVMQVTRAAVNISEASLAAPLPTHLLLEARLLKWRSLL